MGTTGILTIWKKSSGNSFLTAIDPTEVMTMQDIFLRMKRDERREEKHRNPPPEYERLILDFKEDNNPIVIIATFGE